MYPKRFAGFLKIPAEIRVITIVETQTALSLTGQFLIPLLACLFFLLSSSFTSSSDVLGHIPKFLFMFVTSLLRRFYTACLR